jgi:hypothetical protein
MAKDQREGWLKELKVGDRVIVARNAGFGESCHKVENITPSGKIDVNRVRYKPTGHSEGKWDRNCLEQATKERVEKIRKLGCLRSIQWTIGKILDGNYCEVRDRLEDIELKECFAFYQTLDYVTKKMEADKANEKDS